MIDRLIADPAFLPITIIFLLLVIIAIWQKLDRYIIPLTIVFIVYGVFTFFTHPNEEIKYSIPMKTAMNWGILYVILRDPQGKNLVEIGI